MITILKSWFVFVSVCECVRVCVYVCILSTVSMGTFSAIFFQRQKTDCGDETQG